MGDSLVSRKLFVTAPGLCANDYEALRERFEAHGSVEEVRTCSSIRGGIKKMFVFFTFSNKTEIPPPPFLTTSDLLIRIFSLGKTPLLLPLYEKKIGQNWSEIGQN